MLKCWMLLNIELFSRDYINFAFSIVEIIVNVITTLISYLYPANKKCSLLDSHSCLFYNI